MSDHQSRTLRRWRLWLIVIVAGCGGIDFEHQLRVSTDCPDVEKVSEVVYQLRGGGTLSCHVLRVVKGPPYVNARFLECQPPIFPEPPSERPRGV